MTCIIMSSLRAQGHHLLPSCPLMVFAPKRQISRNNRRYNAIKCNVLWVLKFWHRRGWDQAEAIWEMLSRTSPRLGSPPGRNRESCYCTFHACTSLLCKPCYHPPKKRRKEPQASKSCCSSALLYCVQTVPVMHWSKADQNGLGWERFFP